MDNVLLRRSQPISAKKNPYNRFDLVENPFPRSPTVTPGSHDPRVNGEIYCESLRGEEQKQFERLLVPHPERSSTRPMASLMDLATRRGRGIGKTAFLNHQRRQIMTDMGNQYTNGAYVLLAAHLIPEGGGRTRKSWQFIRLIAQSLNTNRCIASAIWRLRAFSGVIPDEIMDKINSDDLEGTIGNNRWLENEGINVAFDLNASVKRKLRDHGVSEEIAHALATYGTSHETWEQGFLSQQSDYQWRQMGSTWVFDEFVRLFQAAEINQVLLLVDEVEKIVSPQNRQERRAFAEDIRLFFIDGPFQSVLASPHFGVLWTISPYLQELWQPYWKAVGLDRICPIGGPTASEYTINFYPLEPEEAAIPLVLAYLDHFRTVPEMRGELKPFNEQAVIEALKLSGGVPGPMLILLRLALEHSIRESWEIIRVDNIRTIYKNMTPSEPTANQESMKLSPPRINIQRAQ